MGLEEDRRTIEGRTVLLYDGVCGMCNRFVQFVLRFDKRGEFLFVALQSELAKETLRRHGHDPEGLDTVVLVTDAGTAGEKLRFRSDAATEVLMRLGGFWKVWGTMLRWLPRAGCDAGYRFVAKNRYRVFGRYESCPIPRPEQRSRFPGM